MFKESLFEISNIRGKYIKVEDLDFSFYFSSKSNVYDSHGIRVKLCWNSEKIGIDLLDGYMELSGDYKYTLTAHPTNKIDSVDIATARYFFKEYKVLFSAVWEEVLDENFLISYLKGDLSFSDLMKEFELPFDNYEFIQRCRNLKELEAVVRKYNIYNMNN